MREPMASYVAAPTPANRTALIAAVDRRGYAWERAIAARAVPARAELVAACQRVVELHGELVSLHAQAQWLRSFPDSPRWEPLAYLEIHDGGFGCDADERLRTIVHPRNAKEPVADDADRKWLASG